MIWLTRWVTMMAWLIWFVVYWGAGTRSYFTHASHSSQLDRISMLIMAVGALGLFGSMVLVLLGIVALPQSELVVLLGAVLACVGVAGSFYCRHFLGRFWSGPTTLQENHEIIDTGPYGIVRHPIYTATLTFLPGDDVGVLGLVDVGAVDGPDPRLPAEGGRRGALTGR